MNETFLIFEVPVHGLGWFRRYGCFGMPDGAFDRFELIACIVLKSNIGLYCLVSNRAKWSLVLNVDVFPIRVLCHTNTFHC